MTFDDSLADEAEEQIEALRKAAADTGWGEPETAALFEAFDRWLSHPQLLDPEDKSLLRVRVLNLITWLIDEPTVGERAWDHIRQIAKSLAHEDPHDLRESWRIATFELAAEPPECPGFLKRLFGLAADPDTRWALFSAYENYPWRLRPHAAKYGADLVSDEDVDNWLISQDLHDDEILMMRPLTDWEFLQLVAGPEARANNPRPGDPSLPPPPR